MKDTTSITLDSPVRIITGPYKGLRGFVVVVGDWSTDAPHGIYIPAEDIQLWMNDDEFRIETTKRKEGGRYEFNKRFH